MTPAVPTPAQPPTAPSDRPPSLRPSGARTVIRPAAVRGRFVNRRRVVFGALMLIAVLAPVVPIGDHAAILLDITARRFYLFGAVFDASDVWLLVFLFAALAFGLFAVTAWVGRVFCGWACPQTVFLEGLYRPIDKLFDRKRFRLVLTPAKHVVFVALSFAIAFVTLAYFVPARDLATTLFGADFAALHAWAAVLTLLLYANFAFFREQVCLVACPYGRLQAVLHDDDSIVIGYDRARGEPRGRRLRVVTESAAPRGDCIDCDRCVQVCPTGIDIRNGLQMECIACAQCIDACDEVMDKVHRPRGLVRYDSQRKFAGGRARLLRLRPIIYTALFLVATTVAFASTTSVRAPLALSVLPARGATFVLDHGIIRNHLEVALTNKTARPLALSVTVRGPVGARLVLPFAHVDLGVGEVRRFPLFVEWRRSAVLGEATVTVDVADSSHTVRVAETARLLAPP